MQAEGAELIAISADPITTVNSTQQTLQITYVLLSDKETKTIGAYNVVDPSEIEGGTSSGLYCESRWEYRLEIS